MIFEKFLAAAWKDTRGTVLDLYRHVRPVRSTDVKTLPAKQVIRYQVRTVRKSSGCSALIGRRGKWTRKGTSPLTKELGE